MSVPDHIRGDEALAVVWSAMNQIAPLSLAETSWDNVGILLQALMPELNKGKKVMLAIDLTTDVVEEALEQQEDQVAVIIVYHPIIFRALKSITFGNSQQRSLLRLAAANISIYTPHTSLDACRGGINDWLIDICTGRQQSSSTASLSTITSDHPAIQPSKNAPEGHEGSGMGRKAELGQGKSISVNELLRRVKEGTKLVHVQLACPSGLDRSQAVLTSVAVCAGSGSSVLNGVSADAYVTGEMSHHEVLACVAQGIVVVLTNHSNSERGYLREVLKARLESVLSKDSSSRYQVMVSEKDRDPLETV